MGLTIWIDDTGMVSTNGRMGESMKGNFNLTNVTDVGTSVSPVVIIDHHPGTAFRTNDRVLVLVVAARPFQ